MKHYEPWKEPLTRTWFPETWTIIDYTVWSISAILQLRKR